jgi:hypothetical protein
VVIATGLIALVDNCIKERWGSKKSQQRIGLPKRSRTSDFAHDGPKTFVQQIFTRRYSDQTSPHRHDHFPVAAY